MAADSRGIVRGKCSECECYAFTSTEKRIVCGRCGHPPTKHVKLDKLLQDPSIGATGTDANSTRPGSSSQRISYAAATAVDSNKLLEENQSNK